MILIKDVLVPIAIDLVVTKTETGKTNQIWRKWKFPSADNQNNVTGLHFWAWLLHLLKKESNSCDNSQLMGSVSTIFNACEVSWERNGSNSYTNPRISLTHAIVHALAKNIITTAETTMPMPLIGFVSNDTVQLWATRALRLSINENKLSCFKRYCKALISTRQIVFWSQ